MIFLSILLTIGKVTIVLHKTTIKEEEDTMAIVAEEEGADPTMADLNANSVARLDTRSSNVTIVLIRIFKEVEVVTPQVLPTRTTIPLRTMPILLTHKKKPLLTKPLLKP